MRLAVHYVDSEWWIQQRLIRLHLLEKSMTGEEIARVLIDTLSREIVPPVIMLLYGFLRLFSLVFLTLDVFHTP